MYYGWRVVAGLFVAQLFSVGFFSFGASLLVLPAQEEFGVGREQVMYGFAGATLVGLVLTPLAGILLDRLSARLLVAGGAVCYALGLWWLSRAGSIWEFVAVFAVAVSIANSFAGPMAASTVIARWFSSNRGKALGIGSMGTSVGGMLVPALLGFGIAALGWRETLGWLALAVLVVMLPAALLVRSNPAEVGVAPESSDDPALAAAAQGAALTTGEILRNPGYWLLGFSLGLLFSTYSALMSNLGAYVQAQGHDAGTASLLITTVALAGLVGKLVFGVMADRIYLKLGLWGAHLLVITGLLLLALQPGLPVMVLAAVSMGLAAGGMLPVWGSMMARIFGLVSYGRAMGLMGPLITLTVMPGFAVMGRMYDASGSYTSSLLLFSGVIVVAAALLLPLRLGTMAASD